MLLLVPVCRAGHIASSLLTDTHLVSLHECLMPPTDLSAVVVEEEGSIVLSEVASAGCDAAVNPHSGPYGFQVRPLRRQLKGLKAWITGQRKDQSPGTRDAVPVVQVTHPPTFTCFMSYCQLHLIHVLMS